MKDFFKKYIDLKTGIIIVLAILLIGFIIFSRTRPIDTHQAEIDQLHKQNTELLVKNDSLAKINEKIDKNILEIQTILDNKNKELVLTSTKLQKLQNTRNEISHRVNTLPADSIASTFANYLNQRVDTNNHK